MGVEVTDQNMTFFTVGTPTVDVSEKKSCSTASECQGRLHRLNARGVVPLIGFSGDAVRAFSRLFLALNKWFTKLRAARRRGVVSLLREPVAAVSDPTGPPILFRSQNTTCTSITFYTV